MLKQQTMTKEQILREVPIDISGIEHYTTKEVHEAMDIYAKQEVAKERERAAKLVEDMKVIAEKVGYIWVREDILKSIEKYNENTLNR